MKLEAVTAELRPRSSWEAMDLGLALVRRDFWPLFRAWWLGMIPALAAGIPLWLTGHPWWFLLVFWWWIPVGSRLVLFHLSRRLFGETPSLRDWLRMWPQACTRHFLKRLFWERFSPRRPLNMAVEDLELLQGKSYRERCRALGNRSEGVMGMLGLWQVALTAWLALSLVSLMLMFLSPAEQEAWALAAQGLFESSDISLPTSGIIAITAASMLSMALTDIFGMGAGFGLYVNHRSWVEGWDVELAFRRMAARLGKIAPLALAVFILLPPAQGRAADPSPPASDFVSPAEQETEVKSVIQNVLRHPAFKVHEETRTYWRLKDFSWDLTGKGSSKWWEAMLKFLKISLLVLLPLLLGWLIWRWRHIFRLRGTRHAPPPPVRAKVVMGMSVEAESLPPDLVSAAWQAWLEGRAQEALGLLYRGAIAGLIHVDGVEIAESDTETDCLRRVDQQCPERAPYFRELTAVWQREAYARLHPAQTEMERLRDGWPFQKGGLT